LKDQPRQRHDIELITQDGNCFAEPEEAEVSFGKRAPECESFCVSVGQARL